MRIDFDPKTRDLSVFCDCGKPIVTSDVYGMFCEDGCGRKEAVEEFKMIIPMIEEMAKECKYSNGE